MSASPALIGGHRREGTEPVSPRASPQLTEQRQTPRGKRIPEAKADPGVWGSDSGGELWKAQSWECVMAFEEGHGRQLKTEAQAEDEGKDVGLKEDRGGVGWGGENPGHRHRVGWFSF